MELVGYEDVEARSHETLVSLVVHLLDQYANPSSLYQKKTGVEYNKKCFDAMNNYVVEITD